MLLYVRLPNKIVFSKKQYIILNILEYTLLKLVIFKISLYTGTESIMSVVTAENVIINKCFI